MSNMDWPDQHGGKVPKPDVSLAREAQGHGTATFGESAVIRATKALLIFANPVAIDCQRRKWPLTFQTLFDTGRLAGLATNETDVHIFSSVQPPASTSSPHTVHLQKYTGVTFGERLEGAVKPWPDLVTARSLSSARIVQPYRRRHRDRISTS